MKRLLQLGMMLFALLVGMTAHSSGAASKVNLPPGKYALLDTVVQKNGIRFLAVTSFPESESHAPKKTMLFQGNISSNEWILVESHPANNNYPGKLVVDDQQVLYLYNEAHLTDEADTLYYKVWSEGKWGEETECTGTVMPESVALNGDLLGITWEERQYLDPPGPYMELEEYPKVNVMIMNLKTKRHWETMLTPRGNVYRGYQPQIVPREDGFDVYCTEDLNGWFEGVTQYHLDLAKKGKKDRIARGLFDSVTREKDGTTYITYRDDGKTVLLKKLYDGKPVQVGLTWHYSRVFCGDNEAVVVWYQWGESGRCIMSRTLSSGNLEGAVTLVKGLNSYPFWTWADGDGCFYGHPFLRFNYPNGRMALMWEDEGQIFEKPMP